MAIGRRRFLATSLVLAWQSVCANNASECTMPPPASLERTALLDAVRVALCMEPRASRFKVPHLRHSGNWAYFAGNEVAPLDGRGWQETDLSVKALLSQGKVGWRVVLMRSLPRGDTHPLWLFEQKLAGKLDHDNIPRGLFP